MTPWTASLGQRNTGRRGYSLIEVLIAGAILLIGISAAAVMVNAIYSQEAADARISQALNMQEQAAVLWQLGLDPGTITNILPANCSSANPPGAGSVYFAFAAGTTNVSGAVNMETLSPLRIIFLSGAGADGSPVFRTNDVTVVRPAAGFR
jgi:prepilin-type N-terminal cleavage/methylation domain-containing protein